MAVAINGFTKADLARKVGVTGSAVNQWLSGDTKSLKASVAQDLERVTGYRADWIINGWLPKRVGELRTINAVPLITSAQAAQWDYLCDTYQADSSTRWMASCAPHGGRSYALQISGDSMVAPGLARSYPAGSFVFVDPDRRDPADGERIIARISRLGDSGLTFKVFKAEDGRRWLQPINPMHEPIRETFEVLGTVIGKWEDD